MIEPRAAAFACLLLLLPGISHSVTTFESPPQAVPLIELFTSEGCHSCPPADAWLSSLKGSAGLWTQYVPVTFHVTYWDGLGWRDRFAQQQFDALQAVRAAHAGTSVYTPGVFVAGKTLRHAFVVMRLQAAQMQDRDGAWHAAFATTAEDTTTHQAAAVWVVDADEQPIQAAGGWLSSADAAQARAD
jgi:hypothetical protein